MSAPANEFQKAVYDLLSADPDVAALVGGRIYDGHPDRKPKFPYITFGPSDVVTDPVLCPVVQDHSLQIDTWSNRRSQRQIKELMFAVRGALHRVTPALPTHFLVDMRLELERVLPDPDVGHHGVQQIAAMIENAD